MGATDELANLSEVPDEKTVSDAIQYFDGLLQDMLNIFTSNTASDKPLKPYKQTDIGFGSSQYNEIIREFIEKTLNENLENSSIDYTKFFEEIIKKLVDLDIDIDYLTAVMAKTSPSQIGFQQKTYGKSVPTSRYWKDQTNEQKIKEVIKREIKSFKDPQ